LKNKELAGVHFSGNAKYIEIPVAQSVAQFGGMGKAKKEAALKEFFIQDIECIF